MSIHIQPLTSEHFDSVADLFNHYRAFYGQNESDGAAEFLRARWSSGQSRIFTAVSEGKAIGFVQCYEAFSSVSLRYDWILNDLFVLPEGRGLHAGSALVDHVLEEATAAEADRGILETASTNTAARRLYESRGFRLEAEGPEYLLYALALKR